MVGFIRYFFYWNAMNTRSKQGCLFQGAKNFTNWFQQYIFNKFINGENRISIIASKYGYTQLAVFRISKSFQQLYTGGITYTGLDEFLKFGEKL